MPKKAIVLFSGGLDSLLSTKILQEQGFEVIPVYFKLPISCANYSPDSKQLGLKLVTFDCTKGKLFKEYIKMLKHPKFGYGSAINPCIDCKIFMLRKAKEYAKKKKIEVIATGEVLEERPMSQNLRALKLIEEETDLNNEILRPLSAKLLEKTKAEEKGLVERKKLLSIKGRKRNQQISLAQKYSIKFPSPAGGCILTDKMFMLKLIDLFKNKSRIEPRDIELLKFGRHFRINKKKIIISRNEQESKVLLNLARDEILMEPKELPGPLTVIEKTNDKKIIEFAAKLTVRYIPCNKSIIIYGNKKEYPNLKKEMISSAATEKEINHFRIY